MLVLFIKKLPEIMCLHCLNNLALQVRRESKDHATLSDLYLNNVITRLTHISDDSARLLKRVSQSQPLLMHVSQIIRGQRSKMTFPRE